MVRSGLPRPTRCLHAPAECHFDPRRRSVVHESPTTRRNDILPVHVNNEQARASTGRPSGRSRNNTDSSIIFMQTSVELFRFFSFKTKPHGSYYIPFANDYIVIQIFLITIPMFWNDLFVNFLSRNNHDEGKFEKKLIKKAQKMVKIRWMVIKGRW